MSRTYVHGYDRREHVRLQDQADTLVDLLHSDTSYSEGSSVLEVGCGTGAQTIPLARNSPGARIISIDISADSIAKARAKANAAGLTNVKFQQADIFGLPFDLESFDHVFVCFVLEHLPHPVAALTTLRALLRPGGRSPSSRETTVRPTSILTATRPRRLSGARSSCSGRRGATR